MFMKFNLLNHFIFVFYFDFLIGKDSRIKKLTKIYFVSFT